MTKNINLIGIGDNGWDSLSLQVQELIANSKSLFGGTRHIQNLPSHITAHTHPWKSPLAHNIPDIQAAPQPVSILASGNPMWHGIGKLLLQHFPLKNINIIPSPSSFDLACARLGWPLEQTTPISLHHLPPRTLLPHLFKNRRIITLTRNASTLLEVAEILVEQNLGHINLTVLEHLGSSQERILSCSPRVWLKKQNPVADLHCLAFHIPENWEHALPLFGLHDNLFSHDNNITKTPFRALTLASLAFQPHAVLWDIGAGSGSVSIEWARMGGQAFPIEQKSKRFQNILLNIEKFGVSNLVKPIQGSAPESCFNLPKPHAIFIGGGLAKNPQLFAFCQQNILPHGRIVANAVTLESEKILLDIHAQNGGSLSQIHLSSAQKISTLHGWKPSMPLIQYVFAASS